MADPVTLAAAAFATAALGNFVQAGLTASAARAQVKAAGESARLALEEQDRQQREVNRIAQEEKGDRARQADRELATLRVVAGERGGLATNTYMRQVQELGFFEGLDISRIESNRKAKIEAIQANKRAIAQDLKNTVIQARNTVRAAQYGAVLGTIQSAVQIGTDLYQYRQWSSLMQNRTTQTGP